MRKNILSALGLLFAFCAMGQTKWYNPMEEKFPVIQQQGWTAEIGQRYQRLPDRAKELVRPSVWNLSGNSAGLAIHFYTNARKIEIRYGVSGDFAMHHMPATGKSGVDLYAIDPEGRWRILTDRFAFGDYHHLYLREYHTKRPSRQRLRIQALPSVVQQCDLDGDWRPGLSRLLVCTGTERKTPLWCTVPPSHRGVCASRPATGMDQHTFPASSTGR